ncbi:MAG: phosphodiesterase [Planctomycetaceae bacterium]|nr:phosphodiesterase [Planctomycetaceae bacterium]
MRHSNWRGCSLAVLFVVTLPLHRTAPGADQLFSRIAFGSCCKQDQPAPIFDAIVDSRPDLFLMIGDNIYGDTEDMDVLWAKYQLLAGQPGFQRLRQACPILATWDDHDYGRNDAGREYARKAASQRLFLDFFGVPKDGPRRSRLGVYSAHVLGPPGRRVQIVLLDTRYFRSPLKRGSSEAEPGEGFSGVYRPVTDPETTMLGGEQWAWLEDQLKRPAELRIIASSIQVLPDEHGWEKWGNFPHERKRLLRVIAKTDAAGVLFISGDRHLAEQMRIEPDASGVDYRLFEVTSSSLNRPSGRRTKAGTRFGNELNRYRVGLTYFDINFGMIRVDWAPADPVVRLQVCDAKGDVVLQQRMRLSQLQPGGQ